MDPEMTASLSNQQGTARPRADGDAAACLRPEGTEDPQNIARSSDASPMAGNAALGFDERRCSERYPCSGAVEIQADGYDVHLTGNLTDISLHGCYVEMPMTFPVDTLVTLNIDAHGVRFRTRAKVRVTYPFLGMGICFSETEPGQELQLAELLREIAGGRALVIAQSSGRPGRTKAVVSADAQAWIEAISTFFRNNTVLSRDEFFAIAKRARHS